MTDQFKRRWDGDDWQVFAYSLVQLRHGPTNVQRVPDAVRGDGGLEFFTTDGCLIQCYAPEETVDIGKSSSAIKQKATRDLPKLELNAGIISGMLQNIKVRRWILLCPFFDDKKIVEHVRKKGVEVLAKGLPFLASDFEALVHSQEDFALELESMRRTAIGLSVDPAVDETQVERDARSDFAKRLPEKLQRAYPTYSPEKTAALAKEHVRSYLMRENAMEQLRLQHSEIWERLVSTINSEERRLILIGSSVAAPVDQLVASLDRIESGFRQDLPTLSQASRSILATGTLSDWLIRCPLDFV